MKSSDFFAKGFSAPEVGGKAGRGIAQEKIHHVLMSSSYRYDALGNLVEAENEDYRTRFTYDLRGLVTRRESGDTGVSVAVVTQSLFMCI